MIVRASVAISDNIDHVTTPLSSHLLVCGEAAVLVDTGPAVVHQHLETSLLKFLENIELLRYVFLTSAEFDKIGGLPYLRRLKHNIELICSPGASEELSDVNYLLYAYEENSRLASAISDIPELMPFEEWKSYFQVNRMVSEGDTVDLGLDVDARVFDCPGHRPDARGYYFRPDCALVAGSALGTLYGRSQVAPSFNASPSQTLMTVDKLSALELKFIGLPYCGVIAGDLATRFLSEIRTGITSLVGSTRDKLNQGVLVEEITDEILANWVCDNISPAGPYVTAQKQLVRNMVQAILDER